MAIHIKRNPVTKSGKQTLYLLTYLNYQPYREALNTFVFANPKNQVEREHNKSRLRFAEKVRALREFELDAGDKYGAKKIKEEASFIEYFKVLMQSKSAVDGLFSTWKSTLKHMQVYLGGRDLKFKDCDDDFLKGFKEYLLGCSALNRNLKLSNNSANVYISKVKAALNQAVRDRVIIDNPGKRVDNIKTQETHIEYLTIDEVRLLKGRDFCLPIFKNAFLFSCLSGLRWSDVKKLKWKELIYSETEKKWKIHFTQQKTKAKLYHPIPDQAIELLGNFGEDDAQVFKNIKYTANNNKLLREWVLDAGIKKHITFHCARHTYAVMMQSLSHDIALVSSLLGHKDIKTTMRYAKISNANKNNAVDMYPNIG